MRGFIIGFLLLVGVGALAQDSVTIKVPAPTQVDSSKITAKLIYDDAKAGIQGLAKALKAPAEHVYYILIKQQIVKSIVDLVFILVSTVLIFLMIKGWKFINESYKNNKIDEDNPGPVIMGVIISLAIIIFFFSSVADGYEMVTGFVNPEYGAMKDIFDFVKGK